MRFFGDLEPVVTRQKSWTNS